MEKKQDFLLYLKFVLLIILILNSCLTLKLGGPSTALRLVPQIINKRSIEINLNLKVCDGRELTFFLPNCGHNNNEHTK